MKLFTFCFIVFLFTFFSSCENHMDIRDAVKGTPSRADTVMPHSFSSLQKKDTSTTTALPRVFKR
ncbi:MAG: hypothetical protein ACRDE8_16340 [Ginsengibacter sp.]